MKARLTAHLGDVRGQHQLDLSDGFGRVTLPAALAHNRGVQLISRRWYPIVAVLTSCRSMNYSPADVKSLTAIGCSEHRPVYFTSS